MSLLGRAQAAVAIIAAMHRTFFVALLCTTLSAQAAEPAKPVHHREGGFQNNWIEFAPRGLGELLSWRWQALRQGLPPKPGTPTPQVAPDLEFLLGNAAAGTAMQPAVTWIGHATVLAQMGRINVLTDPIFSERASPVSFAGPKRAHPPGLTLSQLPRIDLVVISHNHYDHCDAESLKALNQQRGGPPLFLVPLGLQAWLAGIGIGNVKEMDWWQSHMLGAVEVVMTPVQHWSGRTLGDRLQTLWGGLGLVCARRALVLRRRHGLQPRLRHHRRALRAAPARRRL
jgi:N-acyl-phosphatidylethanolamine-hydrolysing phospholipase D